MKINEGRSSIQTARAQNDLIFALDIGTRSIIGLVGAVRDEKLQVLAIEKEEHSRRAMIDGQIEDIEQVAKVARHVKERLERQFKNAVNWRDQINSYFYRKSGIPDEKGRKIY